MNKELIKRYEEMYQANKMAWEHAKADVVACSSNEATFFNAMNYAKDKLKELGAEL